MEVAKVEQRWRGDSAIVMMLSYSEVVSIKTLSLYYDGIWSKHMYWEALGNRGWAFGLHNSQHPNSPLTPQHIVKVTPLFCR